jgi:hypothetical protein
MAAEQRRKPPARAEIMQQLAAQWNMQYEPKDEWGLVKKLGDFKLFRTGSSRRITNIVKNRDAMLESAFYMFDYKYTISTGKSSSTHQQTVFFCGFQTAWPASVFDEARKFSPLDRRSAGIQRH